MRSNKAVLLALALSLFSAIAFADSITGVSPTSVPQYSAEVTLTISGTNLLGDVSTSVVYTSSAGTFTVNAYDLSTADTVVADIPGGITATPGTVSVSVVAEDSTGTRTIGPATFTVTSLGGQAPLLSIPEAIQAEATSSDGAVVNFTVGGFSFVDPPPAPTVTCDHTSGELFPLGTTTVHCTATDSFGSTSGTFAITVTDTVPPVLTIPSPITVITSGTSAVITWSTSATDAIDGTVTVICSPASGSTFPLGVTTVRCSATDTHANSAVGFFTCTVAQHVPPTLSLPSDFFVEATSSQGATVNYSATADQGATVVCSPASGTLFDFGTTTVNCSATNSTGEVTNGSFNVTVRDTTAPTLSLPSDITVHATSSSGVVVSYVATATDIVSTNINVACVPPSGSLFPVGTTLVQCSAADTSGNVATGMFNVTVTFDTTPPVLTLPSDITAEATSASGAVVTFTATALDNVDGVRPVTCTPPSGSTFPLGTTTVNCTASDLSGNVANGSFHVTVVDTTPPTVTSITASPNVLAPPNHEMIDVTISVTATDLVDPNPVSQIVSVSSNQPINGTGDGDLAPDWIITGPLTLQLRAERAGTLGDRIYTITVVTTDFSGNATISTVTVTVPATSHGRTAGH